MQTDTKPVINGSNPSMAGKHLNQVMFESEMPVALLPPALRNAQGWLLTNVVVENSAMSIFPHVLCWPNSVGLLGGPDQIFPGSVRSSLMC